MEGYYGVYFSNQVCGKVQIIRQGLYYRFICRCSLAGDVVCRLYVRCADTVENLGVVVPMDGGFGLDTKRSAKALGKGIPEFYLLPRHEKEQAKFIPICPEEPFSYIERLKEAYLAKKDGKIGVMLK